MSSKLTGYLFIFLSVFIYGLYGIYTRNIADSFSAFNIQFFREGLTALIILLLTLLGLSKWEKIKKEDRKYLILLGIVSTLGNVCMYYIYQLLPLGIASFTTYASIIIFSLIMGRVIFNERINKISVISIILAIVGLLVMFQINLKDLSFVGIIAGLAFGFMISSFASITKKIKGSYSPLQVYMIAALITSILSLFISLSLHEPLPNMSFNTDWVWVIIFAISAALANGFYILGLQKKIEISIASIIMPMESVVLAITGYIFYQENMGIRGSIGAIIILIASIIPSLVELKMKKKGK